jgi:hypothetical protein
MSNLDFRYCIRFDLSAHPESPASIGAKFVNTLDALSRIDPIFANWELTDLGAMSSISLPAARGSIAALIEKNVVLDDFRMPSPDHGYHAIASIGGFRNPRGMKLKVDAGGKYEGGTLLEIGDWKVASDPAVVTYPMFKAAMVAINAIWPPSRVCAYAFRMDYDKVPLFPGAALFPYSRFHIPWLAYLLTPLAARVELPAEIKTERTPDDGLLMIAADERLEPTDPEYLRRARILAQTMIALAGERQ